MSVLSQLTSPADLELLAASTQILTSKPEALTAENVTAAAQIANTLLLSPNATEVRTVAFNKAVEKEAPAVLNLHSMSSLRHPIDTKHQASTTLPV